MGHVLSMIVHNAFEKIAALCGDAILLATAPEDDPRALRICWSNDAVESLVSLDATQINGAALDAVGAPVYEHDDGVFFEEALVDFIPATRQCQFGGADSRWFEQSLTPLSIDERGRHWAIKLQLIDRADVEAVTEAIPEQKRATRMQAITCADTHSRATEAAHMLAEQRARALDEAMEQIAHYVRHDALTGLGNRQHLDDRMKALAAQSEIEALQVAILHFDLDGFKQINDAVGHGAGDFVLTHVASKLSAIADEADFLARIGGDEFVLLRLGATDAASVEAFAQKALAALTAPIEYRGEKCRYGVSIGIAIDSGKNLDMSALLINADIALYRAKRGGRNRIEFFSTALHAEILATKRLGDEILAGLERGEFFAYYQPQFDADGEALVGVEALARWRHPRRGILEPVAFLSVAEDMRVLSEIDLAILKCVRDDSKTLRECGIHIPKVSLNVTKRRLQDPALAKHIAHFDFDETALALELLETIFFEDENDTVIWTIDQLKDLGVEIEIDDFGSGHASILSLLKVRPQRLKIDRQLVMPMKNQPSQRRLLQSIVDIGKALGVSVTAEGAETMEHARLLKQIGCDALQGYAFGRPMSLSALLSFLKSEAWRDPASNPESGLLAKREAAALPSRSAAQAF